MQVIDESNLEGPFKPEIVEGVSNGAGSAIRMGGEAQLADVKNANGRVYSEALWKRVFEDQRFRDRLESRKIVGELDHPADGRSKLERAAMVVTDMRMAPSKRYPGKTAVMMTYETLPTPMGKILEALHRANVGLSVSSRGDGEVRRVKHPEYGEAQEVIPESFKFDTFDVVMDPSVDVDIRRMGESSVLAGAVNTILESEGSKLQESYVSYYRQLLESLQPSLEVNDLKKKAEAIQRAPKQPLREEKDMAETAITIDGQKVADLETKLKAAEALVGQMKGQVFTYRTRAEHFEQLLGEAQKELAENNSVIAAMLEADEDSSVEDTPQYQEMVAENEDLRTKYDAAEKLVESLLGKAEEQELANHIADLTESLSPKQVEKIIPFLSKCESITEMDSTMEELRGLLSIQEAVPVAVRLTERNPIEKVVESREPKKNNAAPVDESLTESLALTKAMRDKRKTAK